MCGDRWVWSAFSWHEKNMNAMSGKRFRSKLYQFLLLTSAQFILYENAEQKHKRFIMNSTQLKETGEMNVSLAIQVAIPLSESCRSAELIFNAIFAHFSCSCFYLVVSLFFFLHPSNTPELLMLTSWMHGLFNINKFLESTLDWWTQSKHGNSNNTEKQKRQQNPLEVGQSPTLICIFVLRFSFIVCEAAFSFKNSCTHFPYFALYKHIDVVLGCQRNARAHNEYKFVIYVRKIFTLHSRQPEQLWKHDFVLK